MIVCQQFYKYTVSLGPPLSFSSHHPCYQVSIHISNLCVASHAVFFFFSVSSGEKSVSMKKKKKKEKKEEVIPSRSVAKIMRQVAESFPR